jgi:hypothetical protein
MGAAPPPQGKHIKSSISLLFYFFTGDKEETPLQVAFPTKETRPKPLTAKRFEG